MLVSPQLNLLEPAESAFKYRDLRLVTKTSGLGGSGC